MQENNIVLTGGHAATTAFAVIKSIKDKHPAWRIFWIGAKTAIEGKAVPTLESEIFSQEGVFLKPIFTGRIQRKFSVWTIPSLLKIPFGFIHALLLLAEIKPKAILSFGGFSSFPVTMVGSILGIPVVIHEQTAAVGRANRYAASFARKITLAREESRKYFPRGKCVVVGNPIRPEMEKIPAKEKLSSPPLIFVTGGSRGSMTINSLIDEVLEKVLAKYCLSHQTGELDFAKFKKRKEGLPENLGSRYRIFSSIPPGEMSKILTKADLVVGRAGANTVSEIVAAKKPAILIPIPFSYLDEQTKNARFAEDFGLARVLPQEEATGQKLLDAINDVSRTWGQIVFRVKDKTSPDIGAAARVVAILEEFVR